ncbi:MAG: sialidase family protein [Thermogutta sp.]
MHNIFRCLILAAMAAVAALPLRVAQAAETDLEHVVVFSAGEAGYHTMRIPAIETAADGTLLAFAEARKNSAADPGYPGQEIDLVMKSSPDGGRTWSSLVVLEHVGELWSSANPATVRDRTNGRIWLFYLRCAPGMNTYKARPQTFDVRNLARFSDDHGQTWSEAIDLTAVARDLNDKDWGISVPGPGGAIQARQGRLIVPMWRYRPFRDFVLFSEDHGETWQRGDFVPIEEGVDECQLLELADGSVALDMRQQRGAHRWISISKDGGKTWSEPRAGQTVTPVCCAIERWTLKSAGDDRDRIVWTGPRGPGRNNLTLWVSYDELATFQNPRLIAEGPGAYSDMAVLPDKTVAILWEQGNYKAIVLTRVTLPWVEPR